jgi:hypothetical protein
VRKQGPDVALAIKFVIELPCNFILCKVRRFMGKEDGSTILNNVARVAGVGALIGGAGVAGYHLGQEVGDQSLEQWAHLTKEELEFYKGLEEFATAGVTIDGKPLHEFGSTFDRKGILQAFSNNDVRVELELEKEPKTNGGLELHLDGNSRPQFREAIHPQTDAGAELDPNNVADSYLYFSSGGHNIEFPLAIGSDGLREIQEKLDNLEKSNQSITSLKFENRDGTNWVVMGNQYGSVAEAALVHSDWYSQENKTRGFSLDDFIRVLQKNKATDGLVKSTQEGNANTYGYSEMGVLLKELQKVGHVIPWGDNGLAIVLPDNNHLSYGADFTGSYRYIDETLEEITLGFNLGNVDIDLLLDRPSLTKAMDNGEIIMPSGIDRGIAVRVIVLGYPYPESSATLHDVKDWELGLSLEQIMESRRGAPSTIINNLSMQVVEDQDSSNSTAPEPQSKIGGLTMSAAAEINKNLRDQYKPWKRS